MDSPLVAAIEAGGTKFVCAVGHGPDDIEEARFPTTCPEETIQRSIEFFNEAQERKGKVNAIGIGTFGPADVNPESPTFGHIKKTPKPDWSNTDLASAIQSALGNIPLAFETDVNAAAWGERKWGAANDLNDFIYITVGTGIGGGAVSNGKIVHGISHPEMGHLRISKDPSIDPFEGCCPFHGDCLEGLASGTALEERWSQDPSELPAEHLAWELESSYLADAIINITLTLSPERFILGGGVMQQDHLFPMIRERVIARLAEYIDVPRVENYIVPPGLGAQAGVLGSLALAQDLLK
ncbi:MAG: ROK family protein [Verrucomicrobiota bacterium]|nr:ROK family protein [Verrucomicrobiota bacterium]